MRCYLWLVLLVLRCVVCTLSVVLVYVVYNVHWYVGCVHVYIWYYTWIWTHICGNVW